jgi:hypothetical protein
VRWAGAFGRNHSLRPSRSEVDLFRGGKGSSTSNAEIPGGALNFGMAEQ